MIGNKEEKMVQKVLVTGANGYIGSHVVKFLKNIGIKVVASDFQNTKLDTDVEFYNYDILANSENLNLYEYFGRPDAVVHLAWKDGFNHYSFSHIDNLMQHFYFLKGMIDGGCKSLTVMGTVHEIGYYEGKIKEDTPCNPLSYYGISKNTLRQLLFVYARDMEISLKWLRGYYITGDDVSNHSVFTKILETAKKGVKEFPFTDGTNQFDFIDINDLAKQISLAAVQDKINGIINVCSGQPVSLKEKAEKFIKDKDLDIKLCYGVFPHRKYDSPIVYGDNAKIMKILKDSKYE